MADPVDNMSPEIAAARVRWLTRETERLTLELDDLREQNRRLIASTAHLQGELMAQARAIGPAYALSDEVSLLTRRLDEFAGRPPSPPRRPVYREIEPLYDGSGDAALAAIYRSTSWRVTAPLRRLGQLLGRRRNRAGPG